MVPVGDSGVGAGEIEFGSEKMRMIVGRLKPTESSDGVPMRR